MTRFSLRCCFGYFCGNVPLSIPDDTASHPKWVYELIGSSNFACYHVFVYFYFYRLRHLVDYFFERTRMDLRSVGFPLYPSVDDIEDDVPSLLGSDIICKI